METGFTTNGIIFMTLAWGVVISLFVSCMYLVVKSESKSKSKQVD